VASQEPGVDFYSFVEKRVTERITTNDTGVRTFALSSDNKHMAIVDNNGTVMIYGLHRGLLGERAFDSKDLLSQHSALLMQTIVRDAYNHGCRLAWYEKGKDLALLAPSTGCVTILQPKSGKWDESFLFLPSASSSAAVTVVLLSPKQDLLAAADSEGGLHIWSLSKDLSESKLLTSTSSPLTPIYDLAWDPETTSKPSLLVLGNQAWIRIDHVVDNVLEEEDTQIDDDALLHALAEAEQLQQRSKQLSESQEALTDTQLPEEEEEKFFSGVSTAGNGSIANTSTSTNATAVPSAQNQDQPVVKKRLKKTVELGNLVALPASSSSSASMSVDPDDLLFRDDAPAKSTDTSTPAKTKAKTLFDDEAEDSDADDSDEGDGDVLIEEDDLPMQSNISASKIDMDKLLQLAQNAQTRKLQPAFQPSSSRPDEKSRRYLVWNHVGNVTIREETLENRIEIRFTSANTGNRNEAFADRSGFVMAALSYEGAVFATEAEPFDAEEDPLRVVDKKVKGSTIYYHAFPGKMHLNGSNESFRCSLGPGENVLSLAAGKGWIAAATSKQLLRIYSATGSEIMVSWLRGPVLAMSGCEDKLAIIYHSSTPANTESSGLCMQLLEIDWTMGCRGRMLVDTLPVPLSPKSQLEWIGFDMDIGVVCIMDSQGMLSALLQSLGWVWMPVLDVQEVRKTIDHKYWPITIRGDKLVFVLLNGESKPAVYPQPVVSAKGLRLSLAKSRDGKDIVDSQREKLHKLLWEEAKTAHMEAAVSSASTLLMSAQLTQLQTQLEAQQLEADKTVLKMFQEACQSEQLALALNLASRIRTTKVLEAAITVANHFGRSQVAQMLDHMLQQKQYLEQMQMQMQYGAVASNLEQSTTHDNSYTSQYDAADMMVESVEEVQQQSAGVLSRKASLKQQYPPSKSLTKAVSPEPIQEAAHSNSASSNNTVGNALNPFAVNKTGNTPIKRKSMMEEAQEFKASPSPKKPTLSVSYYIDYVIIKFNIHLHDH
jgi:hypothetical protein